MVRRPYRRLQQEAGMGDMEDDFVGRSHVTGEYALCNNPACIRAFKDLERRIRDIENDEAVAKLTTAITSIQVEFATLKGKLSGWMFAGGLVGTVVGSMVAVLAMMLIRG